MFKRSAVRIAALLAFVAGSADAVTLTTNEVLYEIIERGQYTKVGSGQPTAVIYNKGGQEYRINFDHRIGQWLMGIYKANVLDQTGAACSEIDAGLTLCDYGVFYGQTTIGHNFYYTDAYRNGWYGDVWQINSTGTSWEVIQGWGGHGSRGEVADLQRPYRKTWDVEKGYFRTLPMPSLKESPFNADKQPNAAGMTIESWNNAIRGRFVNAIQSRQVRDTRLSDLFAMGVAISGVYSDGGSGDGFNPDGTPVGSPGDGSGDGGTGGTPSTGTTSPACTKMDGTTSGNPYDCAPSDEETKCGIIDIPCNLKKLFIPSPDFFTQLFSSQNISKTLNLPVVPLDEWRIELFGGAVVRFADYPLPAAVQTTIKGVIWFGIWIWLLGFFGIPNPFGSLRGNSMMGDVVEVGHSAAKALNKRHHKGKGKK